MRSYYRWKYVVGAGVVAAAALAMFFLYQPHRQEQLASRTIQTRFASWNEFNREAEKRQVDRRKVIVIGIDGVPWHYLDKLIAEGELPNLARIKREGAFATLRSVPCYVTPPAWTAMFTGYNPEKSGIYSFGKWLPDTQEFISIYSDDAEVPFVWDAASTAGRKVAVANVPMTYPAYPVNGIMVSGILTPIEMDAPINVNSCRDPKYQSEFRQATGVTDYNSPIYIAAEDSLNVMLCMLHDTTDDQEVNYDTVNLRILSKAAEDVREPQLDLFKFEVAEFSPWLRIRYVRDGELRMAHSKVKIEMAGNQWKFEFSGTLFPIEVQYTYPDNLHQTLIEQFGYYLPTKFMLKSFVCEGAEDMAEYAAYFHNYDDWDFYAFVFTQTDDVHHLVGFTDLSKAVYKTVDGTIGEIMERIPPGTTLLIASDHGNTEYEYGIDLNTFFFELGLLYRKDSGEIDHDRTLIFHNQWYLFLNRDRITVDELARVGIDVPAFEDPLEVLIDYVRQTALEIRSPDGSRNLPVEFFELGEGRVGSAPDMIITASRDDYLCDFWNMINPHPTSVRKLVGKERFNHIRDGVFLAWGDPIRKGYDAGIKQISDVAPTILYLMGLPVAPDMDGRMMDDIFEPGFAASNPLYVNEGYREGARGEIILENDKRESLYKKLKSLGYAQ